MAFVPLKLLPSHTPVLERDQFPIPSLAAKAIRIHDPLFLSSIHLGHQDSLLYIHFFRTHPSSISSSIYCGTHLSLYLNIFM
jgi:hypothetical protein